MPNPFIHCELATKNLPKAKTFYAKLFDWKLIDYPAPPSGGAYTIIQPGKVKYGCGGGMMKQKIRGAKSAWMPYVRVKDIDAATKKAKKFGAKIMTQVTEVEGMGWLSVIVDPTGATLGLFEPKRM